VESADDQLTPLDALFLQRAYELAARGIGSSLPNPPVGAVIARDGRVIGEGFHRRTGGPHAEAEALAQAGAQARGATLYVSLEPCRHVGRTPPCTDAVLAGGIARVVAGTLDPTEHGGGAALLASRGIDVRVAEDPVARELIEIFALTSASRRPYVALKMAMSLDGAVARRPGEPERLSGEREAVFVRELRAANDAVMVGAGTVRVDDPQLTVRPAHHRARPSRRVVACESGALSVKSRVFAVEPGYDRTIVLAPAGRREELDALHEVAEVIYVGDARDRKLDLPQALEALREREIFTVLCEGGPKLAAALLAGDCVDRFYWAIAPTLLSNDDAVAVLSGSDLTQTKRRPHFVRVERVGEDVVLVGKFERV
jgi:diaminohydroxyphosphoribosylaminopyrimidine deaminase / 5-amino-6-(5-phosphoribosylamino)uracil reductase